MFVTPYLVAVRSAVASVRPARAAGVSRRSFSSRMGCKLAALSSRFAGKSNLKLPFRERKLCFVEPRLALDAGDFLAR